MAYLTHSNARSIAESMWGKGGTSSEKVNRRGCFWFNCSSHEGFIISRESLTDREKRFFDKHAICETGTRYRMSSSQKSRYRFWHPNIHGRREYRYKTCENIDYYILEGDCDATIAWVCGINFRENPISWIRAAKGYIGMLKLKDRVVKGLKLQEEMHALTS